MLKNTKKRIFIMFIGSPASGKSFLCHKIMERFDNFERMNNDTDKTKIVGKFKNALNIDKTNIIIDNTNCKKSQRDKFFDSVKSDSSFFKILIILNASKNMIFHTNSFRKL